MKARAQQRRSVLEEQHPELKGWANYIRSRNFDADRLIARVEKSVMADLVQVDEQRRPYLARRQALIKLIMAETWLDREMVPLNAELARGPRQGESKAEFGERLGVALMGALERTSHFLPKPGPGRPPRTFLTWRFPGPVGRPRRYDSEAIADWADQHLVAEQSKGRQLSFAVALREVVAEAMKKREPARYRRLRGLVAHYQEEEPSLSPEWALGRAFKHPTVRRGSPNLGSVLRLACKARRRRSCQ
jgi:hypothetical protein